MKRILVAYCTNAGSTAEVAGAITEALAGDGMEVDLKRFDEIADLPAYSAVVVGGPMIIGWHRKAVRFLKKNRRSLSRVPVALFFTAMQITKTGSENGYGFPVLLDPRAAKDPADPARLKFK
ncbi:MAG TPA: flavodoxin domain-containing protein, partial [Spirochaetia bacterium]|nr:flavodoxin domain-containing protein [Spirochaetia bacterium]